MALNFFRMAEALFLCLGVFRWRLFGFNLSGLLTRCLLSKPGKLDGLPYCCRGAFTSRSNALKQ